MAKLPAPHSEDVDSTAFVQAVREGIADADAGRVISYDAVRRWLLSWGADKELPPPE